MESACVRLRAPAVATFTDRPSTALSAARFPCPGGSGVPHLCCVPFLPQASVQYHTDFPKRKSLLESDRGILSGKSDD